MKLSRFSRRIWGLLVVSGSLCWSPGARANFPQTPVLPPLGGGASFKSQWTGLRPEVTQVLSAILEEHRRVTSEPIVLRIGSIPSEMRGRIATDALRALEAAKLGGARRNGVFLWLVPDDSPQAGVALGFAVDSVWSLDERETWVHKRVLPSLRRDRLDQAAGAFVWGALEGLQSPIIQKNDVRSRLEKVGALVLEELPEEGGLDRGMGISGGVLALIFSFVLGVLLWVFAVAAGGEREFDGQRWKRIPLGEDLWERIQNRLNAIVLWVRKRKGETSSPTSFSVRTRSSTPLVLNATPALDLRSAWLEFQSGSPLRVSVRKTQSLWDRDLQKRCRAILEAPSARGWDAVLLIHPQRKCFGWAERGELSSPRSTGTARQLEFLASTLRETQFETAIAAFLQRSLRT